MGKVKDRFGGMGMFTGCLRGQQCTGVSLINIREHIQYVYIVQYYIVLINE